jgi:RimJ/RimL family protein N-acetyltransferase
MLEREGTRLRPIELEDLDRLYTWHQDLELDAWSGWTPRLSRARFEQRYGDLVREPPDDFVWLGIEYAGELVGYVELAEISRIARRGAIGFVVAERSARGRGVGTNAVLLLLDYAFALEDLDRVYAEVYPWNQASVALLERIGFTLEGRLRQHEVHQGRREDLLVYGILRHEFRDRYPTVLPDPGGSA